MSLSPDQIAFFKTNGYLILPSALSSRLCERALDRLWDSLPATSPMRRDDPSTHVGPFSQGDELEDATNLRKGFRWQLRSIGATQDLIDLVYSETLTAAAESLLGKGQLRQPVVGGTPMGSHGFAWPGGPVDPALGTEGARGIYCTLPYEGDAPSSDGPHTDGHPFMLSMVGLLADSPPRGGAFHVWPGSHRRLYPTFWMQYDQARIPFYDHMPSYSGLLNPPAYHEELSRILEDTEPVDCYGNAGDVVLWHHRLVHSAGENHSSVMRCAVLGDFARNDLDQLRMDPPQRDMWRDWSGEVQASAGSYPDEFGSAQRLG